MKINKQRVGGAILATKKFIKNCKNKEKYTDFGLTIYGCECRNLREYEQILQHRDTKELGGRLLALYESI